MCKHQFQPWYCRATDEDGVACGNLFNPANGTMHFLISSTPCEDFKKGFEGMLGYVPQHGDPGCPKYERSCLFKSKDVTPCGTCRALIRKAVIDAVGFQRSSGGTLVSSYAGSPGAEKEDGKDTAAPAEIGESGKLQEQGHQQSDDHGGQELQPIFEAFPPAEGYLQLDQNDADFDFMTICFPAAAIGFETVEPVDSFRSSVGIPIQVADSEGNWQWVGENQNEGACASQ